MANECVLPEVRVEPHDGVDLAKAVLIAQIQERNDDTQGDGEWGGDGEDLLESLERQEPLPRQRVRF